MLLRSTFNRKMVWRCEFLNCEKQTFYSTDRYIYLSQLEHLGAWCIMGSLLWYRWTRWMWFHSLITPDGNMRLCISHKPVNKINQLKHAITSEKNWFVQQGPLILETKALVNGRLRACFQFYLGKSDILWPVNRRYLPQTLGSRQPAPASCFMMITPASRALFFPS